MSGETNSDLSRALAQLTIFTLWREAGLPGRVPDRDDIVKSPFREDNHASFSIGEGGKVFKDWGSDQKGGLMTFAKLSWPNDTEEQLRDRLVDIAGTRTHRSPVHGQPFSVGPDGQPQAAAPVDPMLAKAAKALVKRQRLREDEDRIYAEHAAALLPNIEEGRRYVPPWPDCVRERYLEGNAALKADGKRIEDLAKARGWPYYWVEELLAMELLAYTWERGCTPGDRGARRQKSFRVDYPIIVEESGGARVTLQPVGYHQRFFMPEYQGKQKKGWMYLPSFPKFAPRSEFEHAIVDAGVARKLRYEPETKDKGGIRDQFIPPLPFVLGDLTNTRTVVLLEGQWDAISFFGACGWFHDTAAPAGVAVFGIRGAQGMDPFLGYWGRWLRACKPLAWVIADNDNAGGAWREAPKAELGKLQPPSLADRLIEAGCRDVKVSWLKPGPYGKDFNDYYRAKTPDPEKMYKWMDKVGVLAGGRWA